MPSPPPHSDSLLNRGFVALLITQFFGAVNDSILKQVLILAVAAGGIWADQFGDGGQGYVSLCLTVPFILLSGFAGQFADRTSKRRIAVRLKFAEIVIAVAGLAAFLAGNLWAGLGALILLAIQSSFFGPAKYGMIPELVTEQRLSQANGTINMMTNLAVIAGTVLAGFIYAWYAPQAPADDPSASVPDALLWVPGVVLILVAILGLLPSFSIPKLKASDPNLKIDYNPFRIYFVALKEMSRSALLLVALAWAFFYLIAMLVLLIIPDYGELLQITPQKTSMLLGVIGISIGCGSILAGLISGKHIEPRLVPLGAVGMTVFFLLLGSLPLQFTLVLLLLTGAGFFAGLYIVPLQALLQKLSPPDERGRFLGTTNALAFVFSSIGSLLVPFFRQTVGLEANRVFLAVGALAFLGTGVLLWRLRKLLADPGLRREETT